MARKTIRHTIGYLNPPEISRQQKTIPVIAIYHAPQECGVPTVSLISQQTGEILEKLEIPEDYYYSGQEQVEVCTPVRQFTEHICQAIHKPTVETVKIKASFGPHARDHKFKAIEITNLVYDTNIPPTWDADILVEEYISDIEFEYHPEKDTFKQTMEAQCIDMDPWPLPVRQKTELMTFLKTILSSYKDYKVINLIRIG